MFRTLHGLPAVSGSESSPSVSIPMSSNKLSHLLKALSFATLIAVAAPQGAQAKLRVSGIFSDHMVVQRDKPIQVWGSTDPGEIIGVRLKDKQAAATADAKGHWQVTLGALPAGGPYELVIVDQDEKIAIQDVLVGEVWLSGGQSTMVVPIKSSNVKNVPSKSFDGQIRVMRVPLSVSKKPLWTGGGEWTVVNNLTLPECAAVPTCFAMEVHQALGIPVGVITSAVSSSRIECWISGDRLATLNDGGSILSKAEDHHIFYQNWLTNWHQKNKKPIQTVGVKVEPEPTREEEKAIAETPFKTLYPAASLFNGMFAPIIPFGVKGLLWYQGDSNVGDFLKYPKLFSALVTDWRDRWKDHSLPVLFVQLAPSGERKPVPAKKSLVAELRNAQAEGKLVPFTYMAVAIDSCNNPKADFNACDKRLIAHRLAQIALATQYNQPHPYRAPTAANLERVGNKVKITFKDADAGLQAPGVVKGFAIAGDDNQLMIAEAKIHGDSVTVWNDLVKVPTMVTYGWADNPDCNLYSASNLPVVPFRKRLH